MKANYPQYIVDMFYDYLKEEANQSYDPNKAEQMLYMIEDEVFMYQEGMEEVSTDAGWYVELMNEVMKQYNYQPKGWTE